MKEQLLKSEWCIYYTLNAIMDKKFIFINNEKKKLVLRDWITRNMLQQENN